MNFQRILAVGVAAAICSFAYPQASDKPVRPTEITSEHLRMENDGEKSYFVFTGSVALQATNLDLICDQLEVFVRRNAESAEATIGDFEKIRKILATGNVTITQAERVATAGLVEVYPADGKIVLKEDPMVSQMETTLSGLEITIERGKGVVIVPGSKENKVRFVGPSITDLGFETDKDVEVEGEEETPIATETDGSSPDVDSASGDPAKVAVDAAAEQLEIEEPSPATEAPASASSKNRKKKKKKQADTSDN